VFKSRKPAVILKVFIVDCIMCGIETKVLCFETFEIHRKSIEEGRNDSMEEGDSLLALACSSGYFELARVSVTSGV
jgi:hypothetical protein